MVRRYPDQAIRRYTTWKQRMQAQSVEITSFTASEFFNDIYIIFKFKFKFIQFIEYE